MGSRHIIEPGQVYGAMEVRRRAPTPARAKRKDQEYWEVRCQKCGTLHIRSRLTLMTMHLREHPDGCASCQGAKHPGPKPVSRNGYFPGRGWPKKRTPFSMWLRLTRAKRDLTRDDVANATGISLGAIRDWEQANKCPNLPDIYRLARFFGVHHRELFHKLGVLTPEEHDFLTRTREGVVVLANLQKIMDQVGEPTRLKEADEFPEVYAEHHTALIHLMFHRPNGPRQPPPEGKRGKMTPGRWAGKKADHE